jgi:hypothetical protein
MEGKRKRDRMRRRDRKRRLKIRLSCDKKGYGALVDWAAPKAPACKIH